MLFDRQKRLLALVAAHGGDIGNLDFQKLLFLYCREAEEVPTYEFVPYRFGGFSFTSYADKRRLVEQILMHRLVLLLFFSFQLVQFRLGCQEDIGKERNPLGPQCVIDGGLEGHYVLAGELL